MKEQFRSNIAIEQFNNGVLLTTHPFPPTLGREGEIFMAEPGNGDIPAGNVSKEPRVPKPELGKPLTPKQREIVTNRWQRDYLKGRDLASLPFGERQAVEAAINEGILPVAGGADPIPDIVSYTDETLRNIAFSVNDEINRNGPGKVLDYRYLQRQLQTVENLMAGGTVNADEARNLLRTLNGFMAEAISNAREYGGFGQRQLTDEEKNLIRDGVEIEEIDRLFNRMFERVDVNPKVEFRETFGIGTYEYDEFIRTINEVGFDLSLPPDRREKAKGLARRYGEERKLREIAHNANYVVSAGLGTEQLVNFAQQFDTSLADLAFSKDGVVEAFHFFEQALLKVREENGGFLPPDQVTGDPQKGTLGKVETLVSKYMDAKFPALADWKKTRAISIARGMGILTGRTIEIAASSVYPENPKPDPDNPDNADPRFSNSRGPRYVSMYAQTIIQDIALFRHLIFKYNIGGDRNRILAYLLNRDKSKKWTKEELAEFDEESRIDIINGLVGDSEERFLGSLNPFKVGGILSRTTWRLGEDPVVGAVGDFVKEDPANREWIGTGVIIEVERGKLKSPEALKKIEKPGDREEARTKSEEAEHRIRQTLQKVAHIQPLKLFYNIRDLQKEVLTQDGRDFTDDTLQQDLDKLVILQEDAVKNRLLQLNFGDDEQGRRLSSLVDKIRNSFINGQHSRLDTFIENLRDKEWRLPFNFGTDDVPFEQYRFSKTGGTSIARRWGDIGAARTATAATIELIKGMDTHKTQEPVVAAIRKVAHAIEMIDESLAREVVLKLAEGVMKFYKKDWYARLPAGVGTLFNVTGRHSFAELAFGKGQMSWDEVDLNGFTRLLRDQGIVTEEQQHELQGKAGGTRTQTFEGYARLLTPIIILALGYYVLKESAEVVTERK